VLGACSSLEENAVVAVMDRRGEVANLVLTRWGDLLNEISASVVDRDAAELPPPPELMAAAASTGLQALALPRQVGGEGVDPLTWGMVLEQIGYRCMDVAFPLLLSIRTTIAQLLYETGRADVIEGYVIPIAEGRCAAGTAYTEDADAFAFHTQIHRKGDGYVLSGHKVYVTGGLLTDVFLTYPLDEAGDMVACLVHRDDPGVRVTPADGLGHRTTAAGTVTFDDVLLPADRLVAASDGLTHAQRFLSDQRLWIVCAPLGRAQAVLEDCVARLTGTIRYGESVAGMKNVQSSLGRMYVAIESARAMLYHALSYVTAGGAEPIFDPVVSAAKYFVAEQVRFVLELALRVLGGYGYYGTPHLGRYIRDYAGLAVAAGTQDILEVNLGATAVARAGRV
jgi:alkylation response protein AidB-like acyl-CoA dehydrogenase